MISVGINITFFGNCRQGIEFYKKVFQNSNVQIITYGDVIELLGGEEVVGNKTEYIYSAKFEANIKNQKFHLFLSDSPAVLFSSQMGANKDNITIIIEFDDENDVCEYYEKLMENGKSNIYPRKNIRGIMESSLIDQYGVCWILRECWKNNE